MATRLLFGVAFLFVFFGLWAMISPAEMVSVFDIDANTPDARADIRAMYGGVQLTWAAILGWHAMEADRLRQGLFLGSAAIGGMGAARLVSVLISSGGGISMIFVTFEIGLAFLLWWYARQE